MVNAEKEGGSKVREECMRAITHGKKNKREKEYLKISGKQHNEER